MAPFPDEMAQSFLARYFRGRGYVGALSQARLLWPKGELRTTARIELSLPALAREAGFSDVKAFAGQHTLLPYQLGSESAMVRQMLVAALESGEVGRWAPRLTARTSGWDGPRHFRFCLGCVSDDVRQFGETYWHRIHQLPGVTRCHKHRTALKSSNYPIYPARTEALMAADAMVLCIVGGSRVRHLCQGVVYRRIASRSLEVLRGNFSEGVHREHSTYLQGLAALGFEDQSKRLSARRIADALRAHLGRNCRLEDLGLKAWWAEAYRGSFYRPSTVQHIVLQDFVARYIVVAGTQTASAPGIVKNCADDVSEIRRFR